MPPSIPQSPTFASEHSAGPLTVLLADDHRELRDLLQRWISETGSAVTAVSSGRDAIQCLHRQMFDVVVTDILMPDGDGLEVITEIKRSRIPTRILAMSGGGDLLRAEDCLKIAKGLGAQVVLQKPFNRDEFVAALESLLRERRAAAHAESGSS